MFKHSEEHFGKVKRTDTLNDKPCFAKNDNGTIDDILNGDLHKDK